jgi:hypothetical protein
MSSTVLAEARRYDRTAEGLGNIVNLGHVNTTISDQRLSTAFYVTGLGLTRDPYMNTGTNNMWVNVGRSQFHLPTSDTAQVMRGVTGLVVPDLDALIVRLTAVRKELDGTRFTFARNGAVVETTCPWGNRIDLHAPDRERFGPVVLGMAYVAFPVATGTAPAIARFYREIMNAPAEVVDDAGGRHARVQVGERQYFLFRESASVPADDGHHVQIYITDFSGPYNRLRDLGLITQESNRHQYRFVDIIDLDSRRVLTTLDHEVRSMTHPMFARPLCNRNPALSNAYYAPGYEDQPWAMP